MEVVAAVIRSTDGKILITQRGKQMSFTGKWEFPGGKLKEGERPVDALKREILEELCLDIQVDQKILEWTYEYSFGKVSFIAYNSRVKEGVLQLVEHMDYRWETIENLKSYDWTPADLELVNKLSGGNR
jgi:8-oxo-dGTP diphosphatase